ncbi:MAG: polyphosphate polymerase domain-containing protein [Clostridia bacterium]|nr:polyphosphate polymerase domain-containing protein [Clostridia bacterium]
MQNRFAANAAGMPDPRHELKYFISDAAHAQLSALLSSVLHPDVHGDENNEYFIRSLYFDDAYDTAYHTKMSGVETRDKYRIRIYNCSDKTIFLERKHKQGEYISKSSVRITRRLCEQLMDGNPAGLDCSDNPLLRDVYREMRTKFLKPAVIVDYHREAYTHPAEDVRITFDKRLHSGLFSRDLFNPALNGVSPLKPGKMILEVKFNRYLPDYVKALLATTPAVNCAISKYTLCRGFEPISE